MQKETNIKKKLDIVNGREQYDMEAKQLLSDKQILARIMKETVAEFMDYDIEQIMESIEGTPQVGTAMLEPGYSNSITGMNTESVIENENRIFYDILFKAVTPQKEAIGIIINVEMQNDFHPGYDITERGVYYCSRMISSQNGTEFHENDYNDLKKVYSIWICADTPQYAENTITQFSLEAKSLFGAFPGEKLPRYDLLSVIMVCLGRKPSLSANPLCGMLYTIFREELGAKDKEEKLEKDYGLKMTTDLQRKVNQVCNLSEGIYRNAYQNAYQDAYEKRDGEKIIELLRRGKTPEEIHEFCNYPMEQIKEVEKKMLVEA